MPNLIFSPENSELSSPQIGTATAAAVPRNPRRFHFEMIRISVLLGVSLASDGGNAIDFHQRISRQRRDRDRGAGRSAMRKVCREYLVHSVPVFNLHQKYIRLKNAVHRSAADFYKLLHFLHDHAGVRFNRPFFLTAAVTPKAESTEANRSANILRLKLKFMYLLLSS